MVKLIMKVIIFTFIQWKHVKNEVFFSYVVHQKHNISNIADLNSNLSQHNEAHNSELLPIHTETILQIHCAHNGMLNHYKCIVVECFKEIFQGMDTNSIPAVLQALKEINFILTNRALSCRFTIVCHWNLKGSLLRNYQISSALI